MQQIYIKIKNKKMKINDLITFGERMKGLRLRLDPIQVGVRYAKKMGINTYFLCQNVDIIMTDKDHKILYLYPNIRSEKIIFPKRKVYYIYELPTGSATTLKVGDTLAIIEDR